MALGPRLDLRQSQSLVMTPQLQQAIRLLALSNLELEAAIAEAVADNPLVDLAREEGEAAAPAVSEAPDEAVPGEGGDGEAALDIAGEMLDRDYDTGSGSVAGSGDELPDIGERAAGEMTLAEYLHDQIGAAGGTASQQFAARWIIDQLDEAGYLTIPLGEVAETLGISLAEAEAALRLVQSLDPTGVGARDLAECLALQAIETDRYDPCMKALIANLDLLARGNLPQLRRLCRVDDEDLADMIAELRSYDPKPGCRIGGGAAAPVVPDVFVGGDGSGGWAISLNRQTLPRLVIDRAYYTTLKAGCGKDKSAAGWLGEKLADANWLLKALDQRQKTILKVSREIVRRQEGFFRRGVSALIPLTLREVAEAVDLHESTVSRVTSNKFLNCGRGTFELKYFFSSGVAASGEAGAASAEAVKAAIKALIDAEKPDAILSDDTLVDLLKEKGFALARRTVAKYREAIGLGSSVQRRRTKKLAGAR
ncbi:RNA polymerase factor sigma-54 [Croceicoccus naphthovorans]|uniref:RNA polymerase sigma-54 factor n=1 Tax=Croceicoccus naphthovorans TaxID=1348774 RepID=A0A0G3XC62_9SPHN|nr:RNA polymerase factor sigma-54 [Croceicoccus naphthovorans]AKM08772.1 RNA polymerase sigma54 factor [Croceicoccus naphthovorans]MBB3992101.1 RNA polymerase sigma-54 factor [Croceicoccus naphthovorans]